MDNQKFAEIPKALKARGVRGLDVEFNDQWVARMIQSFNATPSPVGITYEAILTFEGLDGIYPGLVTVNRDGSYLIQLKH